MQWAKLCPPGQCRGSVELNGTTDLFAGGLGTSESPLEKAETVVRHLRISGVSHC